MEYGIRPIHTDRYFSPRYLVNHGMKAVLVFFIKAYIADPYGMRHTAESHTDHHFQPRYEKGLNSNTSLMSYKIEHRPKDLNRIICCRTVLHCLHSIIKAA